MKLIVAINNLGYIGKDGKLLIKCKADMQHFRKLTTSKTINQCIVGRKTYEQCIGIKGLPNRSLWVVGTGHNTLYEAVSACLQDCSGISDKVDTWVIGGAEIYSQLLPLCTELHISHIDDDSVGDVIFLIPENYRGKVFHYYFKPDGEDNIRNKEIKGDQGDVANEQQRSAVPPSRIQTNREPEDKSKEGMV